MFGLGTRSVAEIRRELRQWRTCHNSEKRHERAGEKVEAVLAHSGDHNLGRIHLGLGDPDLDRSKEFGNGSRIRREPCYCWE